MIFSNKQSGDIGRIMNEAFKRMQSTTGAPPPDIREAEVVSIRCDDLTDDDLPDTIDRLDTIDPKDP